MHQHARQLVEIFLKRGKDGRGAQKDPQTVPMLLVVADQLSLVGKALFVVASVLRAISMQPSAPTIKPGSSERLSILINSLCIRVRGELSVGYRHLYSVGRQSSVVYKQIIPSSR